MSRELIIFVSCAGAVLLLMGAVAWEQVLDNANPNTKAVFAISAAAVAVDAAASAVVGTTMNDLVAGGITFLVGALVAYALGRIARAIWGFFN